ncbi:unnamed protein product [Strongylus vulgaris]|uniref:Tubulin-specific chaperone A n=1 Tax=Strongylus vulgaris TaxID=40348 RepID=A0A3P7LTG1_STRVU|nr:unnamed protein product [Strongylus vulgaris]
MQKSGWSIGHSFRLCSTKMRFQAVMADPAVLKQIKIQTGVVKRLIKEHASYIKEVEKETQKIEKMKAEAKNEDDEYAVKKAGQVLQETRGMIGDTARRCVTATAALQKLLYLFAKGIHMPINHSL